MLANARLRAEIAAQSALECTRSTLQQSSVLQSSALGTISSSAALPGPDSAAERFRTALAAKDDVLRLLQAEHSAAKQQVKLFLLPCCLQWRCCYPHVAELCAGCAACCPCAGAGNSSGSSQRQDSSAVACRACRPGGLFHGPAKHSVVGPGCKLRCERRLQAALYAPLTCAAALTWCWAAGVAPVASDSSGVATGPAAQPAAVSSANQAAPDGSGQPAAAACGTASAAGAPAEPVLAHVLAPGSGAGQSQAPDDTSPKRRSLVADLVRRAFLSAR